jgi:hypothetical protein
MRQGKETVKKCAVCGGDSIQKEYIAPYIPCVCDLEGKPDASVRQEMQYWLMECPQCGYVAEDISKAAVVAREEMMDKYRPFDELIDTPLAARFAKFAQYQAWHGEMHKACDYFLYAAWVCDDMGYWGRARAMRVFALQLAGDLAASLFPQTRARYMLIKDELLRRFKDFGGVFEMDENDACLSPVDRGKLLWEKELTLFNDSAAHSLLERPWLLPSDALADFVLCHMDDGLAERYTKRFAERLMEILQQGSGKKAGLCLHEMYKRWISRYKGMKAIDEHV